jgi:lanosterol synthase
MTERSYVECTASCVAFLARLRDERPHLLRRAPLHGLTEVLAGAVAWLRARQLPQGCWQGAWGVHYVYGTMFGLRGLLAAGVPPTDPAVKKATAWLRAHQKPDGSWGERHAPHTTYYVEAEEGQVVQTAWALHALLLASEPDWDCLDRAARFLARTQLGSGEWPRQEPHGVFFHTALLEYSLYKSYFPLLALAAFEARRRERDLLIQEARRATVAAE